MCLNRPSAKWQISRICVAILFIALMIMLTGCGEQDIGQLVNNGVDKAENGYNAVTGANWSGMWLSTCFIVKRWVPVIMVGSFLIGYLSYRLFTRLKEAQKFALTTLMIYVPVAAFVFGYIYCYIYGVANGSAMPDGVSILLPDATTGLFVTNGIGSLPEIWYNVAVTYAVGYVVAMVLSVAGGIALYLVFKTNREIQKFAKSSLVFGNSVLLVMFGFVYPFLYEVFNF